MEFGLKELKECVDKAWENSKHENMGVELWSTDLDGDEHAYYITNISHFGHLVIEIREEKD